MSSDIEIAQAATMDRITDVAGRLGIPDEFVEPYGHYKAKIALDYLAGLPENPEARLILVTAISPTPPGEGKTTTSVGLGDGLQAIGKRTMVCLREPSLGPVFGMKGGAAGGGHAQIVPMEDINLHFTGDFGAIALANNLLAALIDNHVHHGNVLDIDVRRITWKRVVDMNDRALRDITVALGGPGNGYPRQDGFDIVVASEIMAIFCLATSLEDLKERLGSIVVAYTRAREPVRARDLNAHGAMTVLLKNALAPNLVQTLEHTPAFVHGGPFANIAHGCNSVIATTGAMKLADYVVTEAGFGADLGAEKFVDIKCRKSGLRPSAVVLVATVRALKYHGGADLADDHRGGPDSPRRRHRQPRAAHLEHPGRLRPAVHRLDQPVHQRHRCRDRAAAQPRQRARRRRRPGLALGRRRQGRHRPGRGRRRTVRTADVDDLRLRGRRHPLGEGVGAIATRVYGASEVTADSKIRGQIKDLEAQGYGHFPVCVAKTQYSFSTDPSLRGAPSGHSLNIREVRLAAGAEFIVMVCGDIMTMPGLPKVPSSERIDLVDGQVVGLF